METNLPIVVIEDHAIIRGLVKRVAEDAFGAPDVHDAREGEAGVDLCQQVQPALVLLDLELPDVEGFELIDRIREVAPRARILVLSSHTESYVLHRLQASQVDGFVDKNEHSPEMLEEALRRVADGKRYFSPSVEAAFARFRTDPHAFAKLLSDREQEMLRLFGQGWSDATIAEQVGLREVTVRNHRRNIMSRLGIHSTPTLIRYALEHGFSRVRPDS
ncbi:response regulator [Actomonas aquatica]|uniref:Response regulator transcription factor n=1 Tax=Actomonas aquatica TaxID=2866162 RepID=A0ABZ1C2S4_9BACT|nr:response regulator transcription factor [Opitutus sp. WL0086]WRQ85776.1 response regulator transcription factor [Opitutus sp. WL0086]